MSNLVYLIQLSNIANHASEGVISDSVVTDTIKWFRVYTSLE
jgi:hypothetical protein